MSDDDANELSCFRFYGTHRRHSNDENVSLVRTSFVNKWFAMPASAKNVVPPKFVPSITKYRHIRRASAAVDGCDAVRAAAADAVDAARQHTRDNEMELRRLADPTTTSSIAESDALSERIRKVNEDLQYWGEELARCRTEEQERFGNECGD